MLGAPVVNLLPAQTAPEREQGMQAFLDPYGDHRVLVTSYALVANNTRLATVCAHGVYIGFPKTLNELLRAVALLYRDGQTEVVAFDILTTSGTVMDHDEAETWRGFLKQLRDEGKSEYQCAVMFENLATCMLKEFSRYIFAVLLIPVGMHRDPTIVSLAKSVSAVVQAAQEIPTEHLESRTTMHFLAAGVRALATGERDICELQKMLLMADMGKEDTSTFPEWLQVQLQVGSQEEPDRKRARQFI
jgi:hypothetical protein